MLAPPQQRFWLAVSPGMAEALTGLPEILLPIHSNHHKTPAGPFHIHPGHSDIT